MIYITEVGGELFFPINRSVEEAIKLSFESNLQLKINGRDK